LSIKCFISVTNFTSWCWRGDHVHASSWATQPSHWNASVPTSQTLQKVERDFWVPRTRESYWGCSKSL